MAEQENDCRSEDVCLLGLPSRQHEGDVPRGQEARRVS